jgi:hypothetical protein
MAGLLLLNLLLVSAKGTADQFSPASRSGWDLLFVPLGGYIKEQGSERERERERERARRIDPNTAGHVLVASTEADQRL